MKYWVKDIIDLSFKLNNETDYKVCFEFLGNVDCFHIQIFYKSETPEYENVFFFQVVGEERYKKYKQLCVLREKIKKILKDTNKLGKEA